MDLESLEWDPEHRVLKSAILETTHQGRASLAFAISQTGLSGEYGKQHRQHKTMTWTGMDKTDKNILGSECCNRVGDISLLSWNRLC